MVGHVALEDDLARGLAAPGPARHLRQELEGPLRGPEVRDAQAHVGVHDPDQGHAREVVPLRDHLRADEHVDLALLERGQRLGEHPAPAGTVAVEPLDPRAGQRLLHRLGHALGAEAGEAQVGPAARRARRRRLRLVTAVVAERRAPPLVQRERHRAVRAHGLLGALAAEEARGVAPPVQEDEALLAAREPGGEGVAEGRAEDGVAAGLEHGPAVHDLDAREALRADALREEEALVLAPQRVRVRFDGGSGRAENHRAPLEARAHHRHVAAVVARALVLLVRPVVLLVDDDQPEIGNRREHRGARSDDHPRVALPDAPPLVVPLPRRELAVQHGHRPPEARPRGPQEHRRQADLGDEDDRAAAPFERRLDGTEVDLRLAAAGHAVEQERAEHAAGERVEQGEERGLLVRRRHHRSEVARRQPLGSALLALLDEAHRSLLGEPGDGPAQGGAVANELGHAGAPPGGAQPLQDLGLRAAPRLGRPLGEDGHLHLAKARRVEVLLHLHQAGAAQARHGALRRPGPVASRGPRAAGGRPAAAAARDPPRHRPSRPASRGARRRGSPARPPAAGPPGSTRRAARGSARPSRPRGPGAAGARAGSRREPGRPLSGPGPGPPSRGRSRRRSSGGRRRARGRARRAPAPRRRRASGR